MAFPVGPVTDQLMVPVGNGPEVAPTTVVVSVVVPPSVGKVDATTEIEGV